MNLFLFNFVVKIYFSFEKVYIPIILNVDQTLMLIKKLFQTKIILKYQKR